MAINLPIYKCNPCIANHYSDVIMGSIASQITSLTIVRPVNSPHKRPVTRKMFPFDDVIMYAINSERSKLSNALRKSIAAVPISSSASIAGMQFSTMQRRVD